MMVVSFVVDIWVLSLSRANGFLSDIFSARSTLSCCFVVCRAESNVFKCVCQKLMSVCVCLQFWQTSPTLSSSLSLPLSFYVCLHVVMNHWLLFWFEDYGIFIWFSAQRWRYMRLMSVQTPTPTLHSSPRFPPNRPARCCWYLLRIFGVWILFDYLLIGVWCFYLVINLTLDQLTCVYVCVSVCMCD